MNFASRAMLLLLATISVVLAIWEFAVDAGFVNESFIAAPSQIATTTPQIFLTYLPYAAQTLFEFSIAFVFAALLGVGVGLVLGIDAYLHEVFNPLVGFMLVIPKTALVPLIALWLGYSTNAVIFFGAFLGVFPIILNTKAGVKETKVEYVVMARSMGYSTLDIFRKVILPGIAPSVFTSLFFGSQAAEVGVLIMELAFGTLGVGYLMKLYSASFQSGAVFSVVVLTALILLSINLSIRYISNYYNKWRLQ